MYVNTPSSLHLMCSKLHLDFMEVFITCLHLKHCSPPRLLLSSFSTPSSSLLPSMFNVFLCVCVCLCVSVCFFLWLGVCLPLLAEGDYCPWDRELQSGLWLEKYLTDEEDVGTFKGSNRTACGCVCSNFERDI